MGLESTCCLNQSIGWSSNKVKINTNRISVFLDGEKSGTSTTLVEKKKIPNGIAVWDINFFVCRFSGNIRVYYLKP